MSQSFRCTPKLPCSGPLQLKGPHVTEALISREVLRTFEWRKTLDTQRLEDPPWSPPFLKQRGSFQASVRFRTQGSCINLLQLAATLPFRALGAYDVRVTRNAHLVFVPNQCHRSQNPCNKSPRRTRFGELLGVPGEGLEAPPLPTYLALCSSSLLLLLSYTPL